MSSKFYDDFLETMNDYLAEHEAELEAKIAKYYAKAAKEGRICKVCGTANRKKDWCVTCNRRNASKQGLNNLKFETR